MTDDGRTIRRVHIVNDGSPSWATQVTDVETGDPVEGVTRIELVFDTKQDLPRAIVHTILPRVDVVIDADMKQQCPFCGRSEREEEEEEQKPPKGQGLLSLASDLWEQIGKPETAEQWHAALLLPDAYVIESVKHLPNETYTLHVRHEAIPCGIGAYILPEVVPYYTSVLQEDCSSLPVLCRVEIRQWDKEKGWQTVAITDERKEPEDVEGSTREQDVPDNG